MTVNKWLFCSIVSIASFFFAGCSFGQFSFFGTTSPTVTPSVTCDFTTGNCVGEGGGNGLFTAANCNGVAETRGAFFSFQTWAVSSTANTNNHLIELVIPPGSVCMYTNSTPGQWISGIKKLRVTGTGAQISNGGASDLWIGLGTAGQYQDQTHHALTASVTKGSSCVTLLTVGQTSKFTVGNYALMAGFDLQGYGFPANPHYLDFVKISSIDGGTGQICFTTPLQNTYLSTWPNYPTSSGEIFMGGPATLYVLKPEWDAEIEYVGLYINQPNIFGSSVQNGRDITFRNVTFNGCGGSFPSVNQRIRYINVDLSSCEMEVDKVIGNIEFSNTRIQKIHIQSSSIDTLTIKDSSVVTNLAGTGKKTFISNSTITNTTPGPTGYGRADELACTNCALTLINVGGAVENGTVSSGNWTLEDVAVAATMSAGVITVPNTHGAVRWGVPGNNFTWGYGGKQSALMYQITSVTQDGTNTYFTTTCVGAATSCGSGGNLPVTSGTLSIRVHPAPKFTCTNCTGITEFNTAPVQAPLYSYSKKTYDKSTTTGTVTDGPVMWGTVSTLTFTVNGAYAGATNPYTFSPLYVFGYGVVKADGTSTTYTPIVDLRTNGARTITSSGVTGGGGADSALTLPASMTWMPGVTFPNISANVADWAGTITIEMMTNQGVVYP